MKKTLFKLQSLLLVFLLMAGQMIPGVVAAQELSAPQAPEAPIVSSAPADAPVAPEAPQAPSSLVNPAGSSTRESDTSPQAAQEQITINSTNNESKSQEEIDREAHKQAAAEEFKANYNAQNSGTGNTVPSTGVVSNGNNGDTVISTGNTVNSANIATNPNNNVNTASGAVSPNGDTNSTGASVVNSGSGAGSSNNSAANSNSASITDQNNSAIVKNNLEQTSITGTNGSSFNNGNTTLVTGDSNASGTIMNAVNTNINGVMVSEFNVADDHKGDIVLSPEALFTNCISGCNGPSNILSSGSGANSQNNINTASATDNAVFQNNDSSTGNTMTLSANSGDNNSNFNTNGNTIINTGDANVSANSLNFVNNNISGNVVFGVINIFGTLEGDIILPDYTISGSSGVSGSQNNGNGALSQNNTGIAGSSNESTFQNNDATIVNNLVLNSETGDNSSGFNTDGNTTVTTGQTNTQANVLNVTNTNTQNAPVWLVLINEAGKWFGQLLGVPEGQNFAGSDGTRFEIGSDEQLNVSNNANGSGSVNNTNVNSSSNNTTVQNNSADINNTLNLSANTGGNRADFNTGGNNYINTGSANIIANIINFANNNITGNNPLFVTVVNVFDKWVGDFVAPGQKKKEKHQDKTAGNNSAQQQTEHQNSENEAGIKNDENKTNSEDTENESVVTVIAPKKINAYGIMASGYSKADNNTDTQESRDIFSINMENNKVAGMSSTGNAKLLAQASFDKPFAKVAGTKAISINLAWLILLIPAGVLILIIQRLIHRLRLRKNYYE